MQRVPVNLPHRAVVGPDLRLQIRGQADLREALQNLLAVPVVDRLVVEDQHHAGEAEHRINAQVCEMRDAVDGDFDGDSDLLLHLFGGAAGPLRDDLDVVVGDVRIGFHRQVVKGDGAPDQQQQSHRRVIRKRLSSAKSIRPRIIYCSAVLCRTSAFETTCCAGRDAGQRLPEVGRQHLSAGRLPCAGRCCPPAGT